MLPGQIANMLREELQATNLADYKRELISIYQQIVPDRNNFTRMGPYRDRKETFRKEPRLVNSLSRLLIDAGLTGESDKIMGHFFGERKKIQTRVTLSEHERKNLVEYINSSLFGERFFNRRYGIGEESVRKKSKFAKSSKSNRSNSNNPRYRERDFQTRYGIRNITEETTEPSPCFDDEDQGLPGPVFSMDFNERYGISPYEKTT